MPMLMMNPHINPLLVEDSAALGVVNASLAVVVDAFRIVLRCAMIEERRSAGEERARVRVASIVLLCLVCLFCQVENEKFFLEEKLLDMDQTNQGCL
jgi:hypothetical protein